jgi:hypothetical protein
LYVSVTARRKKTVAELVASMRALRNLYTIFVGKPQRYYDWLPALSDLQAHSRITGLGLRHKERGDRLGSTGSENCPISFFCGYDNGNSGVIKTGNFVDS